MEDRIANINMTINNDDDFLSHFCETGKPLISTELADFIENSANDFHPNEYPSKYIYTFYPNLFDSHVRTNKHKSQGNNTDNRKRYRNYSFLF